MPLLLSSVNGFWKKMHHSEGQSLCLSALTQARVPYFYEVWEIPDTLQGRFDCAVLHICLLLRHIKGRKAQSVFDFFFTYTELTLRELGVSDLRVGKQVKACAKFFYGALKAYADGLEERASLEEALTRNLYGGIHSSSVPLVKMYVTQCDRFLKDQNFQERGIQEIIWPKPQGFSESCEFTSR